MCGLRKPCVKNVHSWFMFVYQNERVAPATSELSECKC